MRPRFWFLRIIGLHDWIQLRAPRIYLDLSEESLGWNRWNLHHSQNSSFVLIEKQTDGWIENWWWSLIAADLASAVWRKPTCVVVKLQSWSYCPEKKHCSAQRHLCEGAKPRTFNPCRLMSWWEHQIELMCVLQIEKWAHCALFPTLIKWFFQDCSLSRCRGQLTGGNGWITMRPSCSAPLSISPPSLTARVPTAFKLSVTQSWQLTISSAHSWRRHD